jgi:DNA ligase (NAD+)
MAPQGSASIRRLVQLGWVAFVSCLYVLSVASVPLPASAAEDPPNPGIRSLTPAEARARIDALHAEIAHHDELYFKRAAPVISDFAYDQLKRELAELEQAFPAARLDAPVVAGVGDDRSGRFPVYRHRERMLSLSKTYSETELRAFDARLVRQLLRTDLEYVVEPKFDGLGISVTYAEGKLVRAVTRGDGNEGDDVTANALAIRTLPRVLRAGARREAAGLMPDLIELRGEIYLSYAEFARINREREDAGEAPFANPRNLAAGTLKQTDAAESARRRLEIVFYGCGACEPGAARPDSQLALLRQLRDWGLPTVESPRVVRGADEMWQAVQAVGRERLGFPFPTDGAVVKLNSVAGQQRVGVTPQAPLWAIAYKFAPERTETRLRAITLQVGRTGVLTPVAEFDPVQLGGATVARASLFNRDEIARRDIRVGDYVYVEKAGEIIPAIAGVNTARRSGESRPYVFPTTCPACNTLLVQRPGEVAVRCPDFNCPVQVRRRIEHFASEACVDIPGLGPAMIDHLIEDSGVKNVADLYRLRREDLSLAGAGTEKSPDRLLAAIERSKQAELWRFIHGLGIPQVGPVTSRCLARHFGSLAAFLQVRPADLLGNGQSLVPGLGEKAALAVLAYFGQTENRAMVADLLQLGVRPMAPITGAVRPLLAGKTFVLTGTLPHCTRTEATDRIEAAGGTVASGISRETDYVVSGEGSGAKLADARSLGVRVIDESALLQLLAPD